MCWADSCWPFLPATRRRSCATSVRPTSRRRHSRAKPRPIVLAPPEAAENRSAPHIVMVSHYFEDHRGGIEIVAGRLARELAGLGYRISWAATGKACENRAWRAIPLRAWNGTERAFGVPLPIPSLAAAEKLADACASA